MSRTARNRGGKCGRAARRRTARLQGAQRFDRSRRRHLVDRDGDHGGRHQAGLGRARTRSPLASSVNSPPRKRSALRRPSTRLASIEPDMKISRIRLSDKTSRLHPRRSRSARGHPGRSRRSPARSPRSWVRRAGDSAGPSQAMEPPPEPTSTMLTMGDLIGKPFT